MPFDGTEFAERAHLLGKIDAVIDLLAREDQWCKDRLQRADGSRCIVGAMMAVGARKQLSRAIADAVGKTTGRRFFRLERFNDDPATDHALVRAVLTRARTDILAGALPSPPSGRSIFAHCRHRAAALLH